MIIYSKGFERKMMFKAGVAFIIIIGLIILGTLVVNIMGVFGLSGGIWSWIRHYIDWSWLEKYQDFVVGSIGALLLLWVAAVAMFQLRAGRRTSYAELLGRLTEEWNSDSFIKSRHLIMKLAPVEMEEGEQRRNVKERMKVARQEKHEDYFLLTKPLDFFEELAFLIRKDYIPLEDAQRTFGDPMIEYYKLFEDCVKEMRDIPGNENAYIELQQVVEKLRK